MGICVNNHLKDQQIRLVTKTLNRNKKKSHLNHLNTQYIYKRQFMKMLGEFGSRTSNKITIHEFKKVLHKIFQKQGQHDLEQIRAIVDKFLENFKEKLKIEGDLIEKDDIYNYFRKNF